MYWVLCHHYSMIHTVQPKHSLLSVKRLQRCSQTALGGWMGGGQGKRGSERGRERGRDSCSHSLSLSLEGNDFSSLPRNMKPESIPTSRALDPEYSRWWHFTMCRRWGVCRDRRECVKYWSLLLLSLFALCLTVPANSQRKTARLRCREEVGVISHTYSTGMSRATLGLIFERYV